MKECLLGFSGGTKVAHGECLFTAAFVTSRREKEIRRWMNGGEER